MPIDIEVHTGLLTFNPILTGGGAIMARTTEDCLPFPCGLRYARQIS